MKSFCGSALLVFVSRREMLLGLMEDDGVRGGEMHVNVDVTLCGERGDLELIRSGLDMLDGVAARDGETDACLTGDARLVTDMLSELVDGACVRVRMGIVTHRVRGSTIRSENFNLTGTVGPDDGSAAAVKGL